MALRASRLIGTTGQRCAHRCCGGGATAPSPVVAAAARRGSLAAAPFMSSSSISSNAASSSSSGSSSFARRAVGRSSGGGGSAAAAAKEAPVVNALEWQKPLQILKYPDPRLRAPNARVGAVDKATLRALADEMFDLMYQDDGVGLAAPQVGVNIRLMVFNEHGPPARGGPSETVLVNPEIVLRSRRTKVDEEGCLSFPKIYAGVERAEAIEVRYTDLDGKVHEVALKGWVACIFQHEYDHLQGVLYHDRMKADQLARVRRRLVALEEAYLAEHPGAAIQRLASGGSGGGAGSKGFGGGGKGFGSRR